MTEPDEALLWAREQSALPAVQTVTAHAYRAGAAASAERIKELEAALDQIYDLLFDAVQADCENGVRSLNEAAAANYLNDFPHTKKALTDIQAVCAWNLWAQPGKPDQ